MRYSLFLTAVVAALARLGQADDCDTGPFASSQVAGPKFPEGNDPETRCNTKWSTGEVIVGIEAWSARFQMKAVRFKYSQSGWGNILGSLPDGNPEQHQQSEWEVTDELAISLWNNKPDDGNPIDAVGRIKITRSGNTIFDVGSNPKKTDGTEIIVNAAGGIIMAARTRTGAWLSSIEFKMLKAKVAGTELIDLKVTENLDDWNKEKKGIETINLSHAYFVNTNPIGGGNLTYTFTTTDSRDEQKKIVSQRTNQWAAGLKVTVGGKVGIPLLTEGSVSVETSFQYTRTNLEGTELTESRVKSLAVTLGTPGTSSLLQPQTAVHCQSWGVTGAFDSAYTGTIEATLVDGSTYKYSDTGDVSSVGWAKASTSCGAIALKDVPAGVVSGQTLAGTNKRAVSFRA